jgi:hypothetical protein
MTLALTGQGAVQFLDREVFYVLWSLRIVQRSAHAASVITAVNKVSSRNV